MSSEKKGLLLNIVMIILIDTNVVLDFLLKNKGFYEDARDVLLLIEKDIVRGYISASAVTDIYYIVRKANQSKGVALDLIEKLVESVHVASIDEGTIKQAIDLKWDDFEDSIQYLAGENVAADYIVTRDIKGFELSNIETITPKAFISLMISEV